MEGWRKATLDVASGRQMLVTLPPPPLASPAALPPAQVPDLPCAFIWGQQDIA